MTNDYGSVRVRAWSGLHPKTRRAKERYGSESAAVVRGTVVLVEVGRLPRGERRRKPKALWLWWHGEGEPDLDLLWKSYCQRFSVEHAIRFLKQALGWTPRACGIPNRPTAGPGWSWPPTPNSVSPGESSRTAGYPGRGRCRLENSLPRES